MAVQNCVIERVYSTSPRKVTEPRTSINVKIINSKNSNDHRVLQKHMNIVLAYNNNEGSHNNNDITRWIKELLGTALDEHPILAGRLRKNNEDGCLEIVSNDSGVRCIEAHMNLSLEEFLDHFCKDKNEVDNALAKLVYWEDIDEANPQFSPLFYIQVMRFKCGGYSIGISYSLMLAEPLLMASSLNNWASLHRNMTSENDISRTCTPLFHTPNFKQIDCASTISPQISNTTTSVRNQVSKTMAYKIWIDETPILGDDIYKYLVEVCLETTESMLSCKIRSNFILITKDPHGNVKVEAITCNNDNLKAPKSLKYEVSPFNLEDLKIKEMIFQRGNEPIHTMQWVACDYDDHEGVVLAVISSSSNRGKSIIMVYITFPMKIK